MYVRTKGQEKEEEIWAYYEKKSYEVLLQGGPLMQRGRAPIIRPSFLLSL